MVFVSVGTQKQDFSRIFKLVENSKVLENEEIIGQSGYTKYESKKIKLIPFIKKDEFATYFDNADIIICHGGVGTIFDGLYKKKKVLAVPRLAKYKEHVNDHQIQICKKLQEEGYILYLDDGEDIDKKLEILKNTTFKEYVIDESYLDVLRKQI